MFLSRLNEISGGCEKIESVSESFRSYLNFLRMINLTAQLTLVEVHFTCTSTNVIYCITCTYCNKFYIGETGRRVEHLCDVERNDKNASKPVAKHFNLPYHSKQHMAVCILSLNLGSSESRKTLEQKFIIQIGTLNTHGINERFSFN